MKKLLTLLFALVVAFSLTMPVFASSSAPQEEKKEVKAEKKAKKAKKAKKSKKEEKKEAAAP